ncbi:MAG: hypothetical protein JWP88_523 [Flaviaesturariibacter sp.]|nr:hypothetical protein [Flaviaesturariibacter sp.]
MLVVYFTVSTGFTVNLHYCMNKFHSWDLGSSEKEKCGQCGMKVKKSSSCCHNDVKVIKLQQDQLSSNAVSYVFSLSLALPIPFQSFNPAAAFPTATYQSPLAHGPPLISERDIYLRNRVFRL